MEYVKALEQAAMLADWTGKSAFIIGLGDDYVVLSSKPKLLGGRSIHEVPPSNPDQSGRSRDGPC
jgi:hypothetical protein